MSDKVINLDNLTWYDTKIKDHIDTKTSGTENIAKVYTDKQIAQEVSDRNIAISTAKAEAISTAAEDAKTYTDTKIAAYHDSTKQNISDKVTTWSTTVDDTHYPSEKLVKDSLDNKENKLPTTTTAGKVLKSTSIAGTVEWGDAGGDISTKMDKANPTGTGSIAVGNNVSTTNTNSQAFGNETMASGRSAHVEGDSTTASGNYSHAEGSGYRDTEVLDLNKIEGNVLFTNYVRYGGVTVGDVLRHTEYGTYKYYNVTATTNDVEITINTTPSVSNVTDWYKIAGIAVGRAAHSEGNCTIASGMFSHAEGDNTKALHRCSHAEGNCTIASGMFSHAEGYGTVASADYSHTEGYGTTANHRSQHVFGEFNITDNSTESAEDRGNYVEIVGKGITNDDRSNARTLDWSGNEWLAGNLQAAGLTDGTTTKTMTEILTGGSSSYSTGSGINITNNVISTKLNNAINGTPLNTIEQNSVVDTYIGEEHIVETTPNTAGQLWASTFGRANTSGTSGFAAFTTGTRNTNNGDSTFVTGIFNTVQAGNTYGSIVGGGHNTLNDGAYYALTVGQNNTLTSDASYTGVFGTANEVEGSGSLTFGRNNYNYTTDGFCGGRYNKTNIHHRSVLGYYNDYEETSTKTRLFEVGNGYVTKEYPDPYSFDTDSHNTINVSSLTGTIIIDIKITNSQTSRFSLNSDWNNFYGYFKLDQTGGLVTTYQGVSAKKLANAYWRITFNLSEITTKTGQPNAVNFIYFNSQFSNLGIGYCRINPELIDVEHRQNAFEVYDDGHAAIQGKLTVADGIDYKNAAGTSFTNGLKFVKCTQAEYDALIAAGTVDDNTIYFIEED